MSGSTIIDQQCTFIEKQGILITTNQLKKSLDAIVIELSKQKLTNNVTIIKQILASMHINGVKSYGECGIVDHQLFIILRDLYLDILRQWRHGPTLDKLSYDVLLKISVSFDFICTCISDTNVNLFKGLLIYKPLVDELSMCLTEIAVDGKHLEDPQINAMDYMIRAIHRIFQDRIQIQNDPSLAALLNAILKCLCSPFFINIFKQITECKELNEAQTLLLSTCLDCFSWYGGEYREKFLSVMRTALLSSFTQWLLAHASTFRQWSMITIKAMKKLGDIILDFDVEHGVQCSEEVYDDCCKVIDSFVFILSSLSNETTSESNIALIRTVVMQLYLLTLNPTILSYIKSQKLPPILLKLSNIANEWIRFNVYRILALILTERDIKELANPSMIAKVFVAFLTTLIDDSAKFLRRRSLLRCLKNLAQHDQIKEELTKQGILPLLVRCVMESNKFDLLKEQQPALEMLLSLVFNEQAAISLKENSQFLSHLKTHLTSSPEKGIQRAAEGLIWKLEKERAATTKSVVTLETDNASRYKYEIMLSYSHDDKDLCHRLYDRLVQDNFRVWIDRDQMYGGTMEAMAHAIENSQFVVVCMSESYKQSVYCRSEAHYAFQRQCHFIPVVMKQKYRPDGWLGIMISGKIFIDFPKLDFNQAYLKLRNEIEQYRKNAIHPTSPKEQLHHSSPPITFFAQPVETVVKMQEEERSAVTNYPHCIDSWTRDHVKWFLLNKNLDSLLPVFANMNGRLIHETYIMCKKDRNLMFQTMKDEVANDGQHKPLTLSTYLCFLDEIQKYIPHAFGDNSPAPVVCTLM